MTFVYAAVWLLIAILLFFKFSKESKIFYLLGIFFGIMSAWWFIDGLMPDIEMLEGTYGLILRCIGAVVLIIVLWFYYKTIYKKGQK